MGWIDVNDGMAATLRQCRARHGVGLQAFGPGARSLWVHATQLSSPLENPSVAMHGPSTRSLRWGPSEAGLPGHCVDRETSP